MKLKEAYDLLELQESATPEEAKKRYRELSKKHHPDLDKTPGADDRFKKINEAYECIKSGKGSDREDLQQQQQWSDSPFNININPMDAFFRNVQQQRNTEHVSLSVTISFAESILGCKKQLNFSRKIKCENCDGNGKFKLHNGCTECGGKGQVVSRNSNMIFTRTCTKCYGKSQVSSCTNCKATGLNDSETSIDVSIPAGIDNNNVLRLNAMGNFVGASVFGEQYTDAHLHVTVTKDPDLSLQNNDVISNLEISLLEALQGCKKTVRTILYDKEIEINPLSKNSDVITIPNMGVSRKGNQKVILNVKYPEDISKLINVLTLKD